jgi:hypothetical protein
MLINFKTIINANKDSRTKKRIDYKLRRIQNKREKE